MGNELLRVLAFLPGALGILLRQKVYPALMGSCGRKGLFGRQIVFSGMENIVLGNRVVIGDNTVLKAVASKPSAQIVIEDDVFIGSGTRIVALHGDIRIGAGTSLGSYCTIEARSAVTIGADTLFAAYCMVGTENLTGTLCISDQTDHPTGIQPLTIGNGCWFGVRSKVLSEVTVGDGAIVGAHTAVISDVAPLEVIVGDPARVIKQRG